MALQEKEYLPKEFNDEMRWSCYEPLDLFYKYLNKVITKTPDYAYAIYTEKITIKKYNDDSKESLTYHMYIPPGYFKCNATYYTGWDEWYLDLYVGGKLIFTSGFKKDDSGKYCVEISSFDYHNGEMTRIGNLD